MLTVVLGGSRGPASLIPTPLKVAIDNPGVGQAKLYRTNDLTSGQQPIIDAYLERFRWAFGKPDSRPVAQLLATLVNV